MAEIKIKENSDPPCTCNTTSWPSTFIDSQLGIKTNGALTAQVNAYA